MKKFCKIIGWIVSACVFGWFIGNLYFLHSLPPFSDGELKILSDWEGFHPLLPAVGLLVAFTLMVISLGVGMIVRGIVYLAYYALDWFAHCWVRTTHREPADKEKKEVRIDLPPKKYW